ncbi:MAG: hypothetical protein AAB447_03760 [Patescibacteria group bacterium]
MAKEKCFWFVHALDANTNRIVAGNFEGRTDEHFHFDTPCKDGVRRHLWECPSYELITRLRADAEKLSLRFQVFCRKGLFGKPELWMFSDVTKKESSAVKRESSSPSQDKKASSLLSVPGVKRGSQIVLPPQVG